MHSASDENKLKTCLTRMIDAISQCIQKLKEHKGRSSATTTTTTDKAPSHTFGDDLNSGRDSVNPRANIFTLDKVENDLLAQLTDDIESFIEDCLPLLTNTCATSFSDYLHQYHYDSEERKFACPLTKNALPILRHELQGLLGQCATCLNQTSPLLFSSLSSSILSCSSRRSANRQEVCRGLSNAQGKAELLGCHVAVYSCTEQSTGYR